MACWRSSSAERRGFDEDEAEPFVLRGAGWRSMQKTEAPCAESARAMAWPSPLDEPVTMAMRLSSRRGDRIDDGDELIMLMGWVVSE